MTGSIAIDVVIGLVFIYLLYSLYATIIMEIISTSFGLRARNLRYTIARMLMDEKEHDNRFYAGLARVIASFVQVTGRSANLTHPVLLKKFFNQPSIKYLGSGGIQNAPSYIAPENFSRALIEAIRIDDPQLSQVASIEEGLNRFQMSEETKRHIEVLLIEANSDLEKFKILLERWYLDTLGRAISEETKKQIFSLVDESKQDATKLRAKLSAWYQKTEPFTIGDETKKQLQSMLDEANHDVVKFKILVEQWYNNTIDRSVGWFKRSTQIILLFISAFIVVGFNVDTIAIIKKLSTDKTAREKLAGMASDFTKENIAQIDSLLNGEGSDSTTEDLKKQLESLQKMRGYLEEDISMSQSIISSNWNLPDTIVYYSERPTTKIPAEYQVITHRLKSEDTVYLVVHHSIDTVIFVPSLEETSDKEVLEVSTLHYKLYYIFSGGRVWGYLLTILALSMGAPFWFDLLNKIVKLRTSKAIPTQVGTGTAQAAENLNQAILNRAG